MDYHNQQESIALLKIHYIPKVFSHLHLHTYESIYCRYGQVL